MNRTVVVGLRYLVLASAVLIILPACGTNGGGTGGAPGLLWTPTSSSGAGGSTQPRSVLWVDPNTGTGGGGFTPFVPSNDVITYSQPTVYIADNIHPLSTQTSAPVITQAEGGLAATINAYRSRQLGGNLGGGGGIGGGGGVTQPPPNQFLQAHGALTMNARANCKHYALYHAGPMAANNPEGDGLAGGGVAPAGRLAKTGITAPGAIEIVISGPGYPDYTTVGNFITANYGNVVTDLQFTHFGTGYWTGGSQQYYWSVIFARNPGP
jgi:hypothetical protein